MVAATSRRQRWKTASIRKDCRDAYACVTSFAFSPDSSPLTAVHLPRRAIAEMETEADMVVEPDVIATGGEGIVAEHGAIATDAEVGLGNAAGEPQSDAMETADPSTTAEGGGGGGTELAAPAG